ncbi:TetR family transcriptional regulator (plasmid) [Paracoccus ferrooxidans]|nr:TetR family transcriptional regulator [Paracoccus ferrooxidans]
MAQVLKEDLRARILQAAGSEFAARGFAAARLADIARQAGTTASNLYKYAPDKEALFLQVVPPELAARHMDLLRARLAGFEQGEAWTLLTADGSAAAAELLAFWASHRHAVAILMSNAQGTRYETMRERMFEEMATRAMLRFPRGDDPALAFVLRRIFSATLDTISAILREYERPEDIGEAIRHFWRFQLAGLQALLVEGSREPGPP